MPQSHSPFDPVEEDLYRRWRERKLAAQPVGLEETLVEIADPRRPTAAEQSRLLDLCRRCNFALYATPCGADADPKIPLGVGQALGLQRLDHNWLGDADTGLTSITVRREEPRTRYIPYTDKPIKWHTDGYYNTPQRWIHGLLLHCVTPAAEGGVNGLMDHEMAYLLLRDADPAFIPALMQPDVMTIPAREKGGVVERAEETGPVFSITAEGELHMRFTERKRSIRWKDDPTAQAAVEKLGEILNHDAPYRHHARLESGMGLVGNNILHDRSAFQDGADSQRLLYRGRYYDRVRDTGFRSLVADL